MKQALLLTLLLGITARAEKEAQRTVDVQAKPACACTTPCNDQEGDSWCFTKWACDVSSTGIRGAWRYCNPATEQERIQAKLRAEGCDTADWKTFRDQLIDSYSARTDGVLEAIDTCRKQSSYTSAKKPVKDKFETCVGRLEKLYKVLNRPGLGLSKNTDAYQKAYTAKLNIPADLAKEALFRDLQATNLSDATSVAKVVKTIKDLTRNAALVVPYVSPGTQSLDNPKTYGRIVVWMNSSGLSRYVQFSVNAAPGDATADRWQASVVNVESKSKAYIFDWTRSTAERHVFEYKSDKTQNSQRCYQCHTSGVLAIHPFEAVHEEADDAVAKKLGEGYAEWLGPLNETYKGELTKLNAQIKKDYGPALVVADAPDRTLDGAFRDAMMPDPMATPGEGACRPKELAAVAAIFNGDPGDKGCLSCHEKRGSPVVSQEGLDTMMYRYIGLGFMPLGNGASAEQRKDASRCYVEHYSVGAPNGSLTAWLKAPACE